MKSLLFGILFIIVVGVGGLAYRNFVEHPARPGVCPPDVFVCPDGTSVGRTGFSCTFSTCLPPNVSLADMDIAFALPSGFTSVAVPGDANAVTYMMSPASSTEVGSIIIRSISITGTSTALTTIQKTAIGGASGMPVSAFSFSSTVLGDHSFTVVPIERFEGVIDTAYYLVRDTDVLRFDAIDRGADWTNPELDVSTLPTHAALVKLLSTLTVR